LDDLLCQRPANQRTEDSTSEDGAEGRKKDFSYVRIALEWLGLVWIGLEAQCVGWRWAGRKYSSSAHVIVTRQPGNPATRQPGNPATRQPGSPAARQPGSPATRQVGASVGGAELFLLPEWLIVIR
jgi:hypothetical protein